MMIYSYDIYYLRVVTGLKKIAGPKMGQLGTKRGAKIRFYSIILNLVCLTYPILYTMITLNGTQLLRDVCYLSMFQMFQALIQGLFGPN